MLQDLTNNKRSCNRDTLVLVVTIFCMDFVSDTRSYQIGTASPPFRGFNVQKCLLAHETFIAYEMCKLQNMNFIKMINFLVIIHRPNVHLTLRFGD
jgi:hypothetical protein